MTAAYHIGDTRAVLASLPENSVDLVLSSPPFFALRSYLPSDDPAKVHEIGSEQTPGEFIDTLLDVTEACARVLAPHGSLCFELGDTYAGSGGRGEASLSGTAFPWRETGWRNEVTSEGTTSRVASSANTGLLDKSLCLIPELFRIALAYGRNPLTGRETERWRVRNVVRWHRPNPPVGALGDKFRPATSDMVVACKSRSRWFDLDAVRTEHTSFTTQRTMGTDPSSRRDGGDTERYTMAHPAGAPPLDTWTVPTAPYRGSHYATWPPALCTRPILAMCPERVCTICGKPSRRVVETETVGATGAPDAHDPRRLAAGGHMGHRQAATLGWTDCGHDTWRRGVVLDPFAGTGTTLMVANGHGRDAIGIDLDARNADLARERVGMFLEVA